MKVGDVVRLRNRQVVHAVAKAVNSSGVTACGLICVDWACEHRHGVWDHVLPPDTPVTCRHCLAAMEKERKNER